MWSIRLERSDFKILNEHIELPVIRVITAHALNVHDLITEWCVDIDIPIQNAIDTIERAWLEWETLPKNFPDDLIPTEWQFGTTEYTIASDNIGIIVSEAYSPEMNPVIFEWLYKTLSDNSWLSFAQVKWMFSEELNLWFDGSMWIQILRI